MFLSRTNGEVVTLPDGLDEIGYLIRIVLGISIKEHKNIGNLPFCLNKYSLYCYALTFVFLVPNNSGSSKLSNLGSVVCASIINNKNIVSILPSS